MSASTKQGRPLVIGEFIKVIIGVVLIGKDILVMTLNAIVSVEGQIMASTFETNRASATETVNIIKVAPKTKLASG